MHCVYLRLFFHLNNPPPTTISTLSLHDALPISILALVGAVNLPVIKFSVDWWNTLHQPASVMKLGDPRSEEHTSELQSLRHLVCRLLLEKKKQAARPMRSTKSARRRSPSRRPRP